MPPAYRASRQKDYPGWEEDAEPLFQRLFGTIERHTPPQGVPDPGNEGIPSALVRFFTLIDVKLPGLYRTGGTIGLLLRKGIGLGVQ